MRGIGSPDAGREDSPGPSNSSIRQRRGGNAPLLGWVSFYPIRPTVPVGEPPSPAERSNASPRPQARPHDPHHARSAALPRWMRPALSRMCWRERAPSGGGVPCRPPGHRRAGGAIVARRCLYRGAGRGGSRGLQDDLLRLPQRVLAALGLEIHRLWSGQAASGVCTSSCPSACPMGAGARCSRSSTGR